MRSGNRVCGRRTYAEHVEAPYPGATLTTALRTVADAALDQPAAQGLMHGQVLEAPLGSVVRRGYCPAVSVTSQHNATEATTVSPGRPDHIDCLSKTTNRPRRSSRETGRDLVLTARYVANEYIYNTCTPRGKNERRARVTRSSAAPISHACIPHPCITGWAASKIIVICILIL